MGEKILNKEGIIKERTSLYFISSIKTAQHRKIPASYLGYDWFSDLQEHSELKMGGQRWKGKASWKGIGEGAKPVGPQTTHHLQHKLL